MEIGKYTAIAIGGAVQAISAGVLAAGGVIQLTPGQQVMAGFTWIIFFLIFYWGEK